jgi:glycosyltransferase involved in cell wall biosynthesis
VIKFAALTPSLAQPGGAERTILIKVRYADPTRMRCTGVAVSGFGGVDGALARELLRYTELWGDTPRGVLARRRPPGLVQTKHRNLKEAVRHVCRDAQVLLTWGSLALAPYTEGLTIPVVCVSHCSDTSQTRLTGVTHLVGVSQMAMRFFDAVPGSEGLPRAVVPNGVEIDRICPRRGRAWQRQVWGVGEHERVVLFLGRQAPDKNPAAAVQALAQLPVQYRLIMVGNQAHVPEQPLPRVVELAARLGVSDRVRFFPPQAFVGDILAGADCLIHPSLKEADSLVVKEAFLAGLPVVHTPTGSLPEIETELGRPIGWKVEIGRGDDGKPVVDPAELACKIELSRRADAGEIIERMRRVAWDRWTAPSMCERWANYLERIVG